MIKAIVYCSKYGISKKYAKSLASILKIPTFSLEEAYTNILDNTEIIYFTNVKYGQVQKLKETSNKYQIKYLFVVHILEFKQTFAMPVYTLPGYLDSTKLNLFDKLVCRMVANEIVNEEPNYNCFESFLSEYYKKED